MYRCGLSPAGGHGPPYPGAPRSVRVSRTPSGRFPAFVLAPFGSSLTDAGIFTATQCHKPGPVGASGSNMVTTKLLVPAGAFVHDSSGDSLPPLHPKVFNTWGSANRPFCRSALVSVNAAGLSDCRAATVGDDVFDGESVPSDTLKPTIASGAHRIACAGIFIRNHPYSREISFVARICRRYRVFSFVLETMRRVEDDRVRQLGLSVHHSLPDTSTKPH